MRYRYTIQQFKIPDGGYHECSREVVAVLGSTYNLEQKAWYFTLLCKEDAERFADRLGSSP